MQQKIFDLRLKIQKQFTQVSEDEVSMKMNKDEKYRLKNDDTALQIA